MSRVGRMDFLIDSSGVCIDQAGVNGIGARQERALIVS
jgi:hypothetical protein